VIAHHPIVFAGIKKLTGKTYVERVLLKAIKNDIAIYAMHTNLDNVYAGVNAEIARQVGLTNLQILSPKTGLLNKLSTFVPKESIEIVRTALFDAGAGTINNYSNCSFTTAGIGTFKGNEQSQPSIGKPNALEFVDENKLEVLVSNQLLPGVLKALIAAHPYEEVAYEVVAIQNASKEIGAGMIGDLVISMDELAFLELLKRQFNCKSIRYTSLLNKKVKRIAICGGAGSFLLTAAKSAGADVFISSDFKYHEFFDADNQLVIADIGHFESEQFTINIFYQILTEKFPTFAFRKTNLNTNPINYI
jgi:dinuclear metal center YbgI/SA1388 family protein